MRINEVLTESQQIEEGPMWDKLKKGASFVGKGIGAVGQGLGAAAGAVSGLGTAIKKGYTGARDTVAGGPSSGAAAQQAPAAQPDPTQQAAPQAAASAQQAPAAQAAPAPAVGGTYKDILNAVMALDYNSQKKLYAQLSKQMPVPAAKPSATPSKTGGAGAFGQMAQQMTGGATQTSTGGLQQQTPTGRVHMANPANPNQPAAVQQAAMPPKQRTGGKVAGQVSQTPNAMRKRAARAASKAMVPEGYYSNFLGKMI